MDDWRDDLVRSHPRLFTDVIDGELVLTASPDVGDGWQDTLDRAIRRLEEVLDQAGSGSLKIVQIKEKFGGLRIYVSTSGLEAFREQVSDVVLLAERRAAGACEVCGRKGRLWSGHGWIKTACEDHASGRPLGPDDPDLSFVDRQWRSDHVVVRTLKYHRDLDIIVEIERTSDPKDK